MLPLGGLLGQDFDYLGKRDLLGKAVEHAFLKILLELKLTRHV